MSDNVTAVLPPRTSPAFNALLAEHFGAARNHRLIDLLEACLKEKTIRNSLMTPGLMLQARHPDRMLAKLDPVTLPFDPSPTERETFYIELANIAAEGKTADCVNLQLGHLLRLDATTNAAVKLSTGKDPSYRINVIGSTGGIHCENTLASFDARYATLDDSEIKNNALVEKSNFSHAKLRGFFAYDGFITDSHFHDSYLFDFTGDRMKFDQCNFGKDPEQKDSKPTIIEHCTFDYCVFKDCDFSHVQFRDCTFTNCTFINTSIDHADLSEHNRFEGDLTDLSGLTHVETAKCNTLKLGKVPAGPVRDQIESHAASAPKPAPNLRVVRDAEASAEPALHIEAKSTAWQPPAQTAKTHGFSDRPITNPALTQGESHVDALIDQAANVERLGTPGHKK